jgi:hypothetical protein
VFGHLLLQQTALALGGAASADLGVCAGEAGTPVEGSRISGAAAWRKLKSNMGVIE